MDTLDRFENGSPKLRVLRKATLQPVLWVSSATILISSATKHVERRYSKKEVKKRTTVGRRNKITSYIPTAYRRGTSAGRRKRSIGTQSNRKVSTRSIIGTFSAGKHVFYKCERISSRESLRSKSKHHINGRIFDPFGKRHNSTGNLRLQRNLDHSNLIRGLANVKKHIGLTLNLILLWCFALATLGVDGFGCFSDYSMSWCNNHTEESCIHDYTFSVSHFQRKLFNYYEHNGRPPLLEAYFMTKTPRLYQKEIFLESDCAPPLIFGFLMVAEARLDFDPNAMAYYQYGMQQLEHTSEDQRYLLTETDVWPLKAAQHAVLAKEEFVHHVREIRKDIFILTDFVLCHCKETELDWVKTKIAPATKDVWTRLFVYEKCHQTVPFKEWENIFNEIYVMATPDPSYVARGDECSAYLNHIVHRWDELADVTIFLQSDPGDHLHFSFLQTVLKQIGYKTYSQDFLHLNGPRHVRTMTPCIGAIYEFIFGKQPEEAVGPYCCAQFAVSRNRIHSRGLEFYENALMLVNGTLPYDLCTNKKVMRSTHCYGLEFLWHVIFGESGDPPLRQDDKDLPLSLRLKYGVEHDKSEWNDVVLSPNVPMKIVTKQEWDGEKFVYLHGGPGSEQRGDSDPRPEWTDPAFNKSAEAR